MTTIKGFSSALALVLFALALTAQAQTPSIEVSTDADGTQFSIQGQAQFVHVEVFSPSGELVYEADDAGGQPIRWPMADQRGARVADGVYLAAITVTDSSGMLSKRVEQIVVGSGTQKGTVSAGPSPEPNAVGTIMGEGTTGKIAKFTGANAIGSSVMTEATGRIGVNVSAPIARLHVSAPALASLATNGTAAVSLLRTSGGKGGDTTGTTGQKGGAGAGLSLVAGDGGDAPAGSKRGDGGSIYLQPGSRGGGAGALGFGGKVLLDPLGIGKVGIGTGNPVYRLHVVGGDNIAVFANSSGNTALYGFSDSGTGVIGYSVTGYAGIFSGKSRFSGNVEIEGSVKVTGSESFGSDTRQMLNLYGTTYGIGVQSGTQYFRTNGGFAWFKDGTHSDTANSPGAGGTRLMRLDPSGNLFTAGAINPTSDRGVKANFSTVNPRFILDRLATIPIQTWNYKTEDKAVRHIGPVAQDFRAAFNLGRDDKTIATVDADGVALASIQALYQMMLDRDKQVQQMMREKDKQIEHLQAQLNQVKRTIRRKRAAKR